MSTSTLPAAPPTGVCTAPHMPPVNRITPYKDAPVFRFRIFGDLNSKNFLDSSMIDPNLLIPQPNQHGVRPGLFVHIGNTSPKIHKATLESKYGFTTEYVDELQLKWQHLKAQGAKNHRIPNPASADTEGGFDPFDPDHAVWNRFYQDRRDAVISEIFLKCFTDRTAFNHLMEVFLPFWKARHDRITVPKGDATVTQNLERIIENKDLARHPFLFDYFESLLQLIPHNEPVESKNMPQQRKEERDIIRGQMGADELSHVLGYQYATQVFIVWLDNICRHGKPSPCSGERHKQVARGFINHLRDFPSFAPVETFTQRYDEYRRMVFGFADWMRVKFSREDYLLRLSYAHTVILGLESTANLDRKTCMTTDGMEDEYVQILCIVWTQLDIKPETWMMHFSHSEETIRQVAQQRAGSTNQGAGQDPIIGGPNHRGDSHHEEAQGVSRDPRYGNQGVLQQGHYNFQVRNWSETFPPEQYASPYRPLQYVNPRYLVNVADPPYPGTEQARPGQTTQADTLPGSQPYQRSQAPREVIRDCIVVKSKGLKKSSSNMPAGDTGTASNDGQITLSPGLAPTESSQRPGAKSSRESRPALQTIQQGRVSKTTASAPGTQGVRRRQVSGTMDLRSRNRKRSLSLAVTQLPDDDEEFEQQMQDLLRTEDPDDEEFVP